MNKKVVLDFDKLLPKKLAIQLSGDETLHFIVVGAGGTGGYLLRDLVRMVSLKNQQERKRHTITVIDGDIVEEKNLTRQNFVRQDIGKNKAVVSAQRYGRSFGIEINVVDSYLTKPEELHDYINSILLSRGTNARHVPVFIDCVDNNSTRLYIANTSNLLVNDKIVNMVLSSGNAERIGQVVLSLRTPISASEAATFPLSQLIEHHGSAQGTPVIAMTPTFFDIFPNVTIDKDPTQLSCAEQAESAPQNIVANTTAASILFGFTVRMLNYEKITTLAVFFNTKTGKQSEFEFTQPDLSRLLAMTTDNPRTELFLPEKPVTATEFAKKQFKEIHDFTSHLQLKYQEELKEEKRLALEEAEASLKNILEKHNALS